ncbi:protein FANTASTIC FOUR 3 [Iris pallida]|uniref:Protein FANTASTIC FOUR 3 n=1 Tax=Iris pallida TaxID=29817 RepID=A0AAX6IL43_IRIPA|nr:protein FANTASTIC FOUR 3 [Iris pallida]
MAAASACASLRSLFDNPLPPENPTLIESLSSWNQTKPIEPTSIAEIFGELYFQEKPGLGLDLPVVVADPAPPPPPLDQTTPQLESKDNNGQMRESTTLDCLLGLSNINRYQCNAKNSCSSTGVFSTKNSDSLLMCTEGLGSESSDDVDDLMEHGDDWRSWGKGRRRSLMPNRFNGYTRRRSGGGASWWPAKRAKEFPPPISSIGRSGKPSVCLRSHKEDGRFVLREVRIPCREWLRASREDGRLKLHFVRPDHEGTIIKQGINEEGEEEEEEEENDREEEQEVIGGINEEEKKI